MPSDNNLSQSCFYLCLLPGLGNTFSQVGIKLPSPSPSPSTSYRLTFFLLTFIISSKGKTQQQNKKKEKPPRKTKENQFTCCCPALHPPLHSHSSLATFAFNHLIICKIRSIASSYQTHGSDYLLPGQNEV